MTALVLGHRAHPRWENTLRALDVCLAAGLDGAEIDVQLLADGEVVVFHDLDLSRLAHDPRRIAELRREDLASVSVFGQRIPTLTEWLARWPEADGKTSPVLNVELKAGGPELVRNTLALLAGRSNIVLSSFDPEMLAAAAGCPHELALLLEPASPAWLHADAGRSFGCKSVHLHSCLVSAASVARHAALGLGVGFWGARDPAWQRRLAALGVVRVITDFVQA
jgi:glycerophosphoryl diester phosphodiesterase